LKARLSDRFAPKVALLYYAATPHNFAKRASTYCDATMPFVTHCAYFAGRRHQPPRIAFRPPSRHAAFDVISPSRDDDTTKLI